MSAARHTRAAFWQQAADIRDEWERIGTACGSTDQTAAELALTDIYRGLGRPRPEFVWVRSPREAQPKVAHLPTLDDLYGWVKSPPKGIPPLAGDLATALTRLRARLDYLIATPWFDPPPPKLGRGEKWPDLPPGPALAHGIPFIAIVRRHVREHLFRALAHGFYLPAKRALGGPAGPLCWYGQQEAHWIAYFDVWHRLGLVAYGPTLDGELGAWATLARSAGWFWPDEQVCVVSHRPVAPMVFGDGWQIPKQG